MFPGTQAPTLKAAIATIHRDRRWWRKLLIGGALWLTILGYPIVEGYQAESIENTQRGFPAPLPPWSRLGDKAVVGLFALVIDFFYFVLPLLTTSMLLMCGAIGLVLVDAGSAALRLVASLVGAVGCGWATVAWFSSVSPVGKRLYVIEGQPAIALSSAVVRAVWQQPDRSLYIRARLRSLPVYLVPVALLAAAIYSTTWSGWLALLLVWLGLSALLYARLVVIQLYAGAAREIELRRFERLQAQTRR